ncbi:questin oxidase family protein [Undibacterium sp. Ji67W]|uniref:questin oxidase family protein n=1 Tax=Undibacterium sp. Ji67W TaxID=3413042 RepID=UPI003BEFE65B
MRIINDSGVLHNLLDANKKFALAAKGTTNHCPMALVALANMGASDQVLQEFFDYWRETFAIDVTAMPSTLSFQRHNYRLCIGQTSCFSELQAYLTQRMLVEGSRAVLEEVLNEIPFAPASGAFHSLIRLAYGIRAEHQGEVAAGLAAMIVNNFPTQLSTLNSEFDGSMEGAFAQLSLVFGGRKFAGEMITSKMRAVMADKEFLLACPTLPHCDDALAGMRVLAIHCYFHTQNFTALHMVTALQAFSDLAALIPEMWFSRMIGDLWVALCVAYVSIGAPALPPLQPVTLLVNSCVRGQDGLDWQDWERLFALARRSKDDHVIKMTYSCFLEFQIVPNPLYLQSVRLMHGLVN